MRATALLMLASLGCAQAASVPQAPSQAPEGLWDHWGDGLAELNGYRLRQPRYGTLRDGEAVLIFVTETFTHAQRVKSDGGHADGFPVLKLNEVRDFQTGMYDYNTMTSVFVPLDGSTPLGIPTKVTASSQEWCGNLFDQLITDKGTLKHTWHSYFDGEADGQEQLKISNAAIVADAMPILVRGLTGNLVAPGEQRKVSLLPSVRDTRLTHGRLSWQDATITRRGEDEITVPGGTFAVEHWTLSSNGLTLTYDVEQSAPHRLIRWSSSDGELGELTGSVRTAYWRETGQGKEKLRSQLGLPNPSWPGATPTAAPSAVPEVDPTAASPE